MKFSDISILVGLLMINTVIAAPAAPVKDLERRADAAEEYAITIHDYDKREEECAITVHDYDK